MPSCIDSWSREVTAIHNPSQSPMSVFSNNLNSPNIHSHNDCERLQKVPFHKGSDFHTAAAEYLTCSYRFQVLQDETLSEEGPEKLDSVNDIHCRTEQEGLALFVDERNREPNVERNAGSVCEGDVDSAVHPNCAEYEACKAQNGVAFGCVPLSPIKLLNWGS